MNKAQSHTKLAELLEDSTIDCVISYLTDCFNTGTIVQLIEHIEEARGINTTIDMDDDFENIDIDDDENDLVPY